MLRTVVLGGILLAASVAGADGPSARNRSRDIVPEVVIPVVPEEHERLHFFDGRAHHTVPGTVTINQAPYRCDLDGRAFTERDAFVSHLRTTHRTAADEVPDRLVVRSGVVHFVRSSTPSPPREAPDAKR